MRGSPISERAMATVWRWPPESEATAMRTEGILAESSRKQLPGLFLHADLVEPAVGSQLVPQPEVGHHVQVVAQRQVLVHRGDAQVPGVGG